MYLLLVTLIVLQYIMTRLCQGSCSQAIGVDQQFIIEIYIQNIARKRRSVVQDIQIIITERTSTMDSLKQLLQKKKQELGSAKIVNLAEIEKQKERKALEEQKEKERIQQEKLAQKLLETDEFYHAKKKIKAEEEQELLKKIHEHDGQKVDESNHKPPLPKHEVQMKLRQYNQPITLFGEDEWSRYRRLIKCENLQNAKTPEQKFNDEEFKKKKRLEEQFEELDAKYRHRLIEPRLMDDQTYRERKERMIREDRNANIPYDQKCDESLLWLRKILKAWGETLEQRYNTEEKKKTLRGEQVYKYYHTTCQQVEPFLEVLRRRSGDKDVVSGVHHMVNCAIVRDYREANDKYIELSIGKAPWPLGVCLLSINVRRNEKKLSHVLTDELSRKWIQSIKRVLGISQELYPHPETAKMVLYSVNSQL